MINILLLLPWLSAALPRAQALSAEPPPLDEPAPRPGRTDVDPEDGAGNAATILALAPNLNDFGRFADGGSDSNWYVGFNNAWIVKLPPAPAGQEFRRAFIGAKLGRAKARPKADKPWELSVIPGKVYMAISQRPSFSSEQSFFLADTDDLPLEPDANVYMPGTGASQWFWAEVRPGLVSSTRPNYLIIWSPARELHDAEHSPILAAMDPPVGDEEPAAWNNHSIQGVPPRGDANALQVPIKIRPALAIKLVPPGTRRVMISEVSSAVTDSDITLRFSVEGKDIESAWVESSQDELEWTRVTDILREPPYVFTIPRAALPQRGGYLRAKARDWTAVEGASRDLLVTAHGAR